MDKLILSYHDACLYKSDFSILSDATGWLNDRIITFYFEYLQREIYENKEILLIGPEVTQAIKLMEDPGDVNAIILDPLEASSRSFIIFVVNDNTKIEAGGSHWSLCVFSKPANLFYHFDSLSGSNSSHCSRIVNILKSCLGCDSAATVNVPCLQQNNSHDCGIFVLCHTDAVCSTIMKSRDIAETKKLEPKKVHVKRSEVIQIIKSLGAKL